MNNDFDGEIDGGRGGGEIQELITCTSVYLRSFCL
jgi:hypothetical protein